MATKRARVRVARGMATATRVVGNKEGNDKGGKGNDDGDEKDNGDSNNMGDG